MNKIQTEVLAWSLVWEGRIGLSKQTQKPHGKHKTTATLLRARIDISNTNRELLEKFKAYIGHGNVNNHDHPSRRQKHSKWNDLHVLRFGSQKECHYILKSIINVLPAKREQATLLLEFLELRKKANAKRNEEKKYSQREWEIFERIRNLNSRGKIATLG
jgi:hypothetical protein